MGRHEIAVRREGERVLLIHDGRLVDELPPQAALELARGLTVQARLVEEQAQARRIVLDQALLMRTGAPFGITNRPDILREAVKESWLNRTLRRYLPGGIKSRAVVGTPTITHVRRTL